MRPELPGAGLLRFVVLATLISAPARAADVLVDYDPEVSLSNLETLGWLPGTPAEDPEVERLIRVAVERELVGVGLKEEREDPDILVVTHASIESEDPIDLEGYDYWQSFEGRNPALKDSQTWSSETGVILVDILDPESKTLIWRGVASGVVGKTAEKRDFRINRAIGKMFKDFPPMWRVGETDGQKED